MRIIEAGKDALRKLTRAHYDKVKLSNKEFESLVERIDSALCRAEFDSDYIRRTNRRKAQ